MALRDELIEALVVAKIPSPRLETDIILKYAAPRYPEVSPEEKKLVLSFLKRREKHEPLDKIIGYREFYKSRFKVNTDVLTPRPDTEILLESTLEVIPQNSVIRILDMGTGSGCILLSLLKERPKAVGIAVDISEKALSIAKENAVALNLCERVEFIHKSWSELKFTTPLVDIIVSNPPYIPSKEIATLDDDVKFYDPHQALDGGVDGLDCYREIATVSPTILKAGGYVILESGFEQDEEITKIFTAQGLKYVKTIPDLAGINRCVILKK